MSDLLTIEEAAERLRVPVNTLRYWRAQGTGPTLFRMGKRLVTTPADVEAFIAAQRKKASVTR